MVSSSLGGGTRHAGLTNPNVRGHGLVLDTKHAPGGSGTIRMGVAAPHSGATVLIWTKQGGGRVTERHPNPSIRPLEGLEPETRKPQCDRSRVTPRHSTGLYSHWNHQIMRSCTAQWCDSTLIWMPLFCHNGVGNENAASASLSSRC